MRAENETKMGLPHAEVSLCRGQDQRSRTHLFVHGEIPDPRDVSSDVKVVELSFGMESEELPQGQEEALETLTGSLQARGVEFFLKVSVHRGNWIHLRSWLKRARRLGIAMTPDLALQSEQGSLAELDGDALACIHGILSLWLREYPSHSDQAAALVVMDGVLKCLRGWQREAADRSLSQDSFVLPEQGHSLLKEEDALEPFLGEMLRIYDDRRVEQWLAGLMRNVWFIEEARQRRSLRLVAFWRACVFHDAEMLPLLREVLGNREEAQPILEQDAMALAGTSWEPWFDGWVKQLRLSSPPRLKQRFAIGALRLGTAKEPARATVIIPSHNHEKFIGDAIRSVLAQTRTDFRLLVIDDHSHDGTVNEAKKFTDPRVRVTRNPRNLGLGQSLARALKSVKTEFVAFLNSDDLFHPRRLEFCLGNLEANPRRAVVASGLVPVNSTGQILSATDSSPVFDGQAIHDWLRWYEEHADIKNPPSDLVGALLERNFLITSSNLVARTDFLKRHREVWKNLEFCVDWQIFLAAALENKLCYRPDLLLGYRLHQTNTIWFDAERQGRYYLELNQVVARILEFLFQRSSKAGDAGMREILQRVTEHLACNSNLDWSAVLIGHFAERRHLLLRDLVSGEMKERVKSLVAARDRRVRSLLWLREFGDNVSGLYRMRGEYPFLRTVRNHYEVLRDDHGRLQRSSLREREDLQRELRQRVAEGEELQGELRRRVAEREELQERLIQRTAERDEQIHSQERWLGDLLLNRLRLRAPLLAFHWVWAALRQRLSVARLAAESLLLRARGKRHRVVATVCHTFPIYSQTFVHQELTQLARQGFDVRLVYSRLDSRDYLNPQFAPLWKGKRRLYLNPKVHSSDFARYQRRMPEKVERLIEKLCESSGMARHDLVQHANFLQAFSFARMVEVYRPEYLHSYFFYDRSLMALVAGYLLDIPRGISCYADHLLKDYELKVVPLHLELCDIIIATSQRIKQELLSIAPNTDLRRILVKPNGIDTECFPCTERTDPADGAPFRLVSVCRIEPKKGLLDLVEAVGLLRQRGLLVEAHLVGTVDEWSEASRDYKRKLDQRITELNLWGTVHLEGRQNLAGVLRFLRMAHLFVAPFVETQVGDKDGIPTAVLEGMATGLPVVATRAGSITEVIEDGRNGLIVPQRDANALAAAISDLIRDHARRLSFGDNAARKVRNEFDVAVCEHVFHDRLAELLASGSEHVHNRKRERSRRDIVLSAHRVDDGIRNLK